MAGLPVADAATTGGDSQRSSGDGSDGEAGVAQSGVGAGGGTEGVLAKPGSPRACSDSEGDDDGGLTSTENREAGLVSMAVVRSYIHAVGPAVTAAVFVSLLTMQLSRNIADWWLSVWTASNGASDATSSGDALVWHEPNGWFLVILATIAGFNAVATAARSFLFAWGGLRGAVFIHNSLLASILSASVSFFDATPVGRIVNRFSRDQFSVDESLPFMLNIFLAQVLGGVCLPQPSLKRLLTDAAACTMCCVGSVCTDVRAAWELACHWLRNAWPHLDRCPIPGDLLLLPTTEVSPQFTRAEAFGLRQPFSRVRLRVYLGVHLLATTSTDGASLLAACGTPRAGAGMRTSRSVYLASLSSVPLAVKTWK